MSNKHTTPWPAERSAEVQRLWQAGKSASEIARAPGCGLTRNAVIGRVHRLGLMRALASHPKANRYPDGKRARAARTDPAATRSIRPLPRKDAKPPVPVAQEPARQAATVTLMDLKACHCRWPIGNPGEPGFGFCGHPIQEGSPYCPTHERKAHQPSRGRLSDAAVGIRRRDKSPVPTFADYERRLA